MNPDNPRKCKELLSDGSCFMKTTELYYQVVDADYDDIEPVMCPFLKEKKQNE